MTDAAPAHVIKRDGRRVPFTQVRITNAIYRAAVAVGGHDRATAERLAGEVVAALAATHGGRAPHVEEIQDAVEKVLIERGHARTAKAYILYRAERARRRQGRKEPMAGDPIPWRKIWHALDWAISNGLVTVGDLNRRIEAGEFLDVVRASEDAYETEIAEAAERLLERRAEVRVAIVAGPSSSGKTTTTLKLAERLSREGLRFVPFHVDDYFFDLDVHPRDEYGDFDYETPQAIDLDLVNDHLRRLLAGEEVRLPRFDFPSGKRIDAVKPLRLGDGDILLIDCLHGLFPALTAGVPAEARFRIYIEPLLQMRGPDGSYIAWTDIRLMRRIVRDARERNVPPEKTLEHWHYVRNAELQHIVPYSGTADAIIASGLAYEPAVMRPLLLDRFRAWEERYAGDPDRADAYERAARVRALLEAVRPAPAVEVERIADGALIREFIGGSRYTGTHA